MGLKNQQQFQKPLKFLLLLFIGKIFLIWAPTIYSQNIDQGKKLSPSQLVCTNILENKISKETSLFNRGHHPLYDWYKTLKAAKKIFPLYNKLNLNASFENFQEEMAYLKRVESRLSNKGKEPFKRLLNLFKNMQNSTEKFHKNSLMKTILALNYLNDHYCLKDKNINDEVLSKGFEESYQQLFSQKEKMQEKILHHQLLLGAQNKDHSHICDHDYNLRFLERSYLDLGNSVQKIKMHVKPPGPEADTAPTECTVCLHDFNETNPRMETKCQHPLCLDCFCEVVRWKSESGEFRPSCVDQKCRESLEILDEKQGEMVIKRGQSEIEQMTFNQLAHSLQLDKRFVRCDRQNCMNFFKKIDENDNRKLECPECQTKTCLLCATSHTEPCLKKTKEMIAQEEKANEGMRRNGFMDCPYCLAWSQKISGCSFTQCPNCRRYFDFVTGGPWTKASEVRQMIFGEGLFHEAIPYPDAEIKKPKKLIYDRSWFDFKTKF